MVLWGEAFTKHIPRESLCALGLSAEPHRGCSPFTHVDAFSEFVLCAFPIRTFNSSGSHCIFSYGCDPKFSTPDALF